METIRLSDEGQIIIPKSLREFQGWETGQELIVTNMGDAILIKPKKQFVETTLDEVAGCLKHLIRQPKTLEEMDDAIRQCVEEMWHSSS
jgi:AbrB family looped-hinge helix DNA binding protein